MKIVKVFIWLGFIALLAVSIPKVAWVFRSYEGATSSWVTVAGVSIDTLWLIPFFVALCIDALILAVTYAVSVDKARASQVSMWLFVGLLCGLSYYCNLLYNNAHAPSGSIWANWFVGDVTPFILSGVPLFALCYTLILSRIEGKGETLEEKATRLENEKDAKERIREAGRGRLKTRLMSAITDTKDVVSLALKKQDVVASEQDTTPDEVESNVGHNADTPGDVQALQNGHKPDGLMDIPEIEVGYSPDIPGDSPGMSNGHNTDKLRIQALPTFGHNADTPGDTVEDTETSQSGYSEDASARSKRQLYVALEDASRQYNYSVDYLVKLVNAGKVQTKRNDRSQLLVSSLNAYVVKHGRRKGDTLTNLSAIHVVNE